MKITLHIEPPVLFLPAYSTLADFHIEIYSPDEEYTASVEIYRRAENEKTPVIIDNVSGSASSYSDKTAEPGKVYYYSAALILSKDSELYKSGLSEEFAVQKSKMTMTDYFSASHKSNKQPLGKARAGDNPEVIELTWQNIPDAEKIIVIKKYPFAIKHIVLAELDGSATTYTDTDISSGETYEYNIVITKKINGNSVITGTAKPQAVTTPKKARITWNIGKKSNVQYITVGEKIESPAIELDQNHKLTGWNTNIPAVAEDGRFSFTATLTGSHTWDNGVITKHPTSEATGIRTYTCSFCKEQKTDTIPTLSDFTLGDIDKDGNITSSDARTALRIAVGLEKLTESQKASADVNKDGSVTSSDARLILRCAVGLEKL